MSTHNALISWRRTTDTFTYETYNREHTWSFGEAGVVQASAAPGYLGLPTHVDPEQAFVASLSSCHMLTFLAVAAKRGLSVLTYTDDARGFLEKDDRGRLAMTRVELRPVVVFDPATSRGETPDETQLARLHAAAHRGCFIANSVRAVVTVV